MAKSEIQSSLDVTALVDAAQLLGWEAVEQRREELRLNQKQGDTSLLYLNAAVRCLTLADKLGGK